MENKLYAIYTEVDGVVCYLGWRTILDEKGGEYKLLYNFVLDNEDSEDVDWIVRYVAFRKVNIELVFQQLQRDIKENPKLSCSFKGCLRELAKLEFKIGEFVLKGENHEH